MLESQSSFLSTPFGQRGQTNRKSSLWLSNGQNLSQGAKILVVSNREGKIEPNPVLPPDRNQPFPPAPGSSDTWSCPQGPKGSREKKQPLCNRNKERRTQPRQVQSYSLRRGSCPHEKVTFNINYCKDTPGQTQALESQCLQSKH